MINLTTIRCDLCDLTGHEDHQIQQFFGEELPSTWRCLGLRAETCPGSDVVSKTERPGSLFQCSFSPVGFVFWGCEMLIWQAQRQEGQAYELFLAQEQDVWWPQTQIFWLGHCPTMLWQMKSSQAMSSAHPCNCGSAWDGMLNFLDQSPCHVDMSGFTPWPQGLCSHWGLHTAPRRGEGDNWYNWLQLILSRCKQQFFS